MFKFSVISPTATYSITSNKASVDEGTLVTITLNTTGVQNGQHIPFLIVGNGINVDDFVGLSSLSGNFVIQNGTASVDLHITEDAITEGLETFDILLFNGSRISVDINDTSTTPVTGIYIGGEFTTYQGTTRNCIARLNTDGSYDSTFNIGTGFDSAVQSVAIQQDGKIVVGGWFTTYQGTVRNRIARLNADGSYDSTFNIGTGFNDAVFSVAIQQDGKIVVGGGFTTYQGTTRNRIAPLVFVH